MLKILDDPKDSTVATPVVSASCEVEVPALPTHIEPELPKFVVHPSAGRMPKTGHSTLNSSFAPKDIAIAVAKWGESPKQLIREMG
jgi:hypothetical protein